MTRFRACYGPETAGAQHRATVLASLELLVDKRSSCRNLEKQDLAG
ncbi:hypothetical protein [Sporolactobacillus sp. THM19-2]|nr:hypothetical protein [Sporolactobacillus sp. THM19-2]